MMDIFPGSDPTKFEAEKKAVHIAGFSVPSNKHPDLNEDAFFADQENMAVGVFDGLGGHKGSEEASLIANDVVAERLGNTPLRSSRVLARKAIRKALWDAHKAIIMSQEIPEDDDQDSTTDEDNESTSIATTAVVAKYFETEKHEQYVVYGNVGDSRAYLLRDGKLIHLTLDDSTIKAPGNFDQKMYVQEKLSNATSEKQLETEELKMHQFRNFIDNTLGHEKNPPNLADGAIEDIPVHAGDVLLLTTDGIHDNLTTLEIEDILLQNHDARIAATALVRAAQKRSRSKHFRAKADDMTAAIMVI